MIGNRSLFFQTDILVAPIMMDFPALTLGGARIWVSNCSEERLETAKALGRCSGRSRSILPSGINRDETDVLTLILLLLAHSDPDVERIVLPTASLRMLWLISKHNSPHA